MCPVGAVQADLKAAGLDAGPLFRGVNHHGYLLQGRLNDRGVALIVKRRVRRSAWSPRASPGTACAPVWRHRRLRAGATERGIMNQTGHRSVMIVRRYIRDGEPFRRDSAAASGRGGVVRRLDARSFWRYLTSASGDTTPGRAKRRTAARPSSSISCFVSMRASISPRLGGRKWRAYPCWLGSGCNLLQPKTGRPSRLPQHPLFG